MLAMFRFTSGHACPCPSCHDPAERRPSLSPVLALGGAPCDHHVVLPRDRSRSSRSHVILHDEPSRTCVRRLRRTFAAPRLFFVVS